jgi:2-C-methyl-D-erythritol 4-phosphate cytidylyltransferase
MTVGAIVPLPMGVDPAAVFTVVGGEAVLARVVRALIGAGRVPESRIVVVCAESLAAGVRECLASYGLSEVAVTVATAPGSRRLCVRDGLECLARQPLSVSQVLLHDHRHPLVHSEVTDRVIAGLRDGDAVVMPALSVTDSVKAVDALGSVGATVDRTGLRTVQFPRGFTVLALSELIGEDRDADFDELGAALREGLPIATVEGDADAIRVELPADAGLLWATTAAGRSG